MKYTKEQLQEGANKYNELYDQGYNQAERTEKLNLPHTTALHRMKTKCREVGIHIAGYQIQDRQNVPILIPRGEIEELRAFKKMHDNGELTPQRLRTLEDENKSLQDRITVLEWLLEESESKRRSVTAIGQLFRDDALKYKAKLDKIKELL